MAVSSLQLIGIPDTWSHREGVDRNTSIMRLRDPQHYQLNRYPIRRVRSQANLGGSLHPHDHDFIEYLWFKHLLAFEMMFSSASIMLVLVTTSVPYYWLFPFLSHHWVRFNLTWIAYTALMLELYTCVCVGLEKMCTCRPGLDYPQRGPIYVIAVWTWTLILVAAVVGLGFSVFPWGDRLSHWKLNHTVQPPMTSVRAPSPLPTVSLLSIVWL